jgi:outer membrane lipoprotein-sorting protein
MRKILLTYAVLFLTLFGFAQQDQKAKDILDKVSEKNRSFKSITADFSFSMTNTEMEDINEKYEGSIKIKGQKYCVRIPEFGATIISDGTTIWNYMEGGNQVTINNVEDEGSELMDPSSLFTIYEKGFSSKYISEKMLNGKTVHEIELYPDSDEYNVSKITVYIDKASMMIHSAVLNEQEGNKYVIEVKKLNTKTDIPDTEFVFDTSKYEDLEIIDWR